MVAILVDEGKLSWITQLQHVIPTFRRPNYDPTRNITISDLLSHRTGLPSYDSFWLQSDNQAPILRKDAVSILSYVPVAADLRTELIYNNLAYEVLGQVIETVSSTSFSSFLTNHILKPLGMNQTFYTSPPTSYRNIAKAYTTLQNTSVLSLPAPIYGEDVLMGPAGGIRSSVHDLLILYSAFIDAANSQIEKHRATIPDNPLKQLGHLWQGLIAVPLSTVREASYASGWLRVQLPAPMGMGSGPGVDPMLGEGLPSRLGLFHEGNIPGYTTFTAVFPETSSAVVVLSNSLGLTNSARLVGQLLIEELFGNSVNTTDYIEYAASTARESASAMAVIRQQLVRSRTVKSPANPLKAYVGIYYNSINTFCIEISQGNGHLRVHFMGRKYEGFKLQPYQHNSFFWHLSYDELAQRARYTTYPKEYYVIEFSCIDDPEGDPAAYDVECKMMNAIRWKHEFTIQGKGEIFYRKDHSEEPFDQNMAQAVLNNEL